MDIARIVLVITVLGAMAVWCVGVHAMFKTLRELRSGLRIIPFFSTDPTYITPEGVRWRRKYHICMAIFIAVILAVLIVGSIFFPKGLNQ
jgi:hypothetical protein